MSHSTQTVLSTSFSHPRLLMYYLKRIFHLLFRFDRIYITINHIFLHSPGILYMNMRVVGIAGSLRIESLNKKLLRASEKILKEIDPSVEYTELDLKTIALPVYDQDIQDARMPENVLQFKSAIQNSDLVIISTPEYNHSIPGGLKNAIDWASRGDKNSFANKVVAIMGATDGMGGTIRSQEHLRVALATLNSFTIPYPEVFIRQAQNKLDEQGNFADDKGISQIRKLLERAITVTKKLQS